MKHPMQPIYRDKAGTIRFKENGIVRYLLDSGPFNLNMLGRMGFSDEDWEQFAQLIGYSVSGFGDLDYPSPDAVNAADEIAASLDTPL